MRAIQVSCGTMRVGVVATVVRAEVTMGRAFQAVCGSCGHTFRASEGGGFNFEALRCDQCGTDTAVEYEAIWDTYLAMLKGNKSTLPEPNGADGQTYPGEPIKIGRASCRERVMV